MMIGQIIELTPTYNSIGVKITNIGTADSCRIEYKPSSQSVWKLAYNPDMIEISGANQFRGSIFMVNESTQYDVRATVYNGANPTVLPIAQATTLNSPTFLPIGNIKWVSPTGNGSYTEASPGSLSTLFSSGQVTCGTTIMFRDDIVGGNAVYSVPTNGFSLTLNQNCTESTPIIFMAAPGIEPIIDAGVEITTSWQPHVSSPNMYFTDLPAGTDFSNVCVIGNTALYPYPTRFADMLFGNYNLHALNFGYDGFVRDGSDIWIKTQAGLNPNDYTVKVSKGYRFLTINGNNNNAYLKVQGIEFKYFAKPKLNAFGSSSDANSATVFDLRNVHNVYFDNCKFIYNNSNITFKGQCDNFTIQNSYFKHDIGKWSHAMIKKSRVFSFFEPTSRGRNVETEAIFTEATRVGVIRNNIFDGTNSGIVCYVDHGLKEDVDVYNNTFMDNFDAVECDGLWSNLRVWNNEFIRPMAGISASPPLIGPRYFYRNVFHGMKGRINAVDDPSFKGCINPGTNYMSQGIALKTNGTFTYTEQPGNLYFFNNTFHASDNLGFVHTSWWAEWRKAVFINNIYAHTSRYPFFYFDLADNSVNSQFQITSINDNYFSENSSSPIVKVKYIFEQYNNCADINSVNDLQTTLSNISTSPNIFIQNPYQIGPQFTSTLEGGFELSSGSPMVEAGTIIQGFYDFQGLRPDIGAKEVQSPLAVNLLYFNGTKTNEGNLLTWETSDESNVINFEIQRSNDGVIFEKLLEIKANRFPSSYNITDYKVNRSHYYRLSIIDLDGFVKYSNIVFITLDDETLIRVLPNPAKDIIQVEIGKSDFEFVISNTMGQHVKIGKSEPFRDISIQELPVGVYFLTIEGITQRFIKQ
jgi:hypothetical protein